MSTREEILSAAVAEVLERDESEFRVTVVAKNAGCATSVLYHYFGSREGLIDSAYISILNQQSVGVKEYLDTTLAHAENGSDAVELIIEFLRMANGFAEPGSRSFRARLIGAAQTRPTVLLTLRTIATRSNAAVESFLRKLVEKGLIRTDLDVPSMALFIRALDYCWVLEEFNLDKTIDFEQWLQLVRVLTAPLSVTG